MKSDKKSLEGCRPKRCDILSCDCDKDRVKLSKRQKIVYDLLCTGKLSVTDITIKLGYSDPRSYIRDIRDKGITVYDQWIENNEVRYKVYWIEPDIHTVGEIIQSDFKYLLKRNHYD